MERATNGRGSLVERVEQLAGVVGGMALAPSFAAISALRNARTFHPRGVVLSAQVAPATTRAPWAQVGERLAGPAIVRLSAALHEQEDAAIDILGCAIRFVPSLDGGATTDGVQDLLLATSRTVVGLPLALLTTDVRDYLANDYYGIAPFAVDGFGRGYLRLRPGKHARALWGSRLETLAQALVHDEAVFRLELRRRGVGRRYQPVATIALRAPLALDQEALAFSPFHVDRGIEPRGFIHALRAATYPASVRGRRWRSPRGRWWYDADNHYRASHLATM